jgi:hypothetical protein
MAMKAKAADERQVMERYEARLKRAVLSSYGSGVFPDETLAILVASAKALYPGRQKRKHVLPALGVMVTAACRVIRRGAK